MSEQWRLNLWQVLRSRPLDIFVIGGLGLMALLCMMSDVIAWPLLPAKQSELAGIWGNNSGVSIDLDPTLGKHIVQIVPPYKSYPITITDSLIVYSDRQQQS